MIFVDWKLKKLWNIKVTFIPIVINALGKVINGLVKGLGNKKMSGDNPNCSIVETGDVTETSSGDLKEVVVPQTSVNDHQLTQMWKNKNK